LPGSLTLNRTDSGEFFVGVSLKQSLPLWGKDRMGGSKLQKIKFKNNKFKKIKSQKKAYIITKLKFESKTA
tara:strand:- start:157 stop:369 length:213 start_codon:yes stop_codon:yes gene_type:complete